jgi:hypothetical protein
MGRHSSYTDEIAKKICDRICQGEGLVRICEEKGMPAQGTVYIWLRDQPKFQEMYTRAREVQQDFHAEQLLEIADEEPEFHHHVGWAHNRIEARKWIMSKLAPRKYGDKVLLAGADGTSPMKLEVEWKSSPESQSSSTIDHDRNSSHFTPDRSASRALLLIDEPAKLSLASTSSSEPPLDVDWSDPASLTSPPTADKPKA